MFPPIRSFSLRQGRTTDSQRLALANLQDQYCLPHPATFNNEAAFGRCAPIIIEIGFGNGQGLAQTAQNHPDNNYLGIEVHKPGIGQLMLALQRHNIANVKIYQGDAVDILQNAIPDNSLTAVHLFFPDPWQKRRHHKRRLVNQRFVELLQQKLLPGGYFHAATDWQHYAFAMAKTLRAANLLVNTCASGDFSPRPPSRPCSKFERRGLRLGHKTWDLIFSKPAT